MQADQDAQKRRTIMRRIQERFFLRFHMSLILLATALSGVLSAKLLLMLQVENIVVRYPLAVIAAYLAFFCFIKLWLTYLTSTNRDRWFDPAGDLVPDLPRFGGSGGTPSFGGGGGTSGGGGASGSFDGPLPNAQAVMASPPSDGASSAGGLMEKTGEAAAGIFDDDGIVLVALALLLAATFGGAIYLIYIAPHILSEAAFDFLLGAGLIKSFRRMDRPDWIGSVFKDTYKPFLIVLVIALVAALIIHSHDPSITKLSDVIRR